MNLEPKPPGPRGFEKIRAISAYKKNPFVYFVEGLEKYGPTVLSESFGFKFYIISKPEDIEHVLVKNAKNYTKDFFLRSWKPIFGEGLLTSEGDSWKRERRMVQPAFHRDRMRRYGELIIESACRHIARWPNDAELDVGQEMTALTLNIVVRTLFGSELPAGTEERVGQASKYLEKYFEFSSTPMGHALAKLPLPVTRGYRKAIRELEAIITEIVKAKKTSAAAHTGDDLLSKLLATRDEDGSNFTEKQLRDEMMTLFLAGHETTALLLTYALFLLGKHLDVQEKACAQIDKALGDEPLTPAHLEKVPYLRQVVTEALRIYPPAWILAREATADDMIAGYPVPKGANVIIPIWAIHRNKEYFDRPNDFDPERWTEEFTRKLPRAAFLPFGHGPRMCIGAAFAMMEAQSILIAILRRFKIELISPQVERLELRGALTAKPKDSIRIKVRTRRLSH